MLKCKFKYFTFIILIILLLIAGQGKAQSRSTKGTEFWVSFMENLGFGVNLLPTFHIFINADVTTHCTITFPASTYSSSFTVNAGETYDFRMDTSIYLYPIGDDAISKKGIKITTDNPVEVQAVHYREYFSDGTLVLPTSELADHYMISSSVDTIIRGAPLGLSEFVVLATVNNTVVDINLAHHSTKGNLSFKKTLNAGESYQVQSDTDLTGSTITEENGNKIAVFSGSTYTYIYCAATSHTYDEDIPMKYWGTYFAAINLKDQVESYGRILAANDSTIITINCKTITINKGQFYSIYFSIPQIISSNKPIQVIQYVEGGACTTSPNGYGDPNMIILQPLTNMLQGYTYYHPPYYPLPHIAPPVSGVYLTIVCQTKDTGRITLNSSKIGGSFSPISENPLYSYNRLETDTLNQTIYSDSFYYAYVYELAEFDAVTYSLGYVAQRPIVSNYKPPTPFNYDTVICGGSTIKLHATGGATYLWKPGNYTYDSPTVTLKKTTTFIVESIAANTCITNNDTVLVTVDDKPGPPVIKYATVKNDKEIDISFLKSDSGDVKSYGVYRSTNGAAYKEVAVIANFSNANKAYLYADTTVKADSYNYTYKIVAVDSCGGGLDTSSKQTPVLLKGKAVERRVILIWTKYIGYAYDTAVVEIYDTL